MTSRPKAKADAKRTARGGRVFEFEAFMGRSTPEREQERAQRDEPGELRVRELSRPRAGTKDGSVPLQRGAAQAQPDVPAAADQFAEALTEDQRTATGSKPRVQKVLYNPNDPQFDSIFSMLKQAH